MQIQHNLTLRFPSSTLIQIKKKNDLQYIFNNRTN